MDKIIVFIAIVIITIVLIIKITKDKNAPSRVQYPSHNDPDPEPAALDPTDTEVKYLKAAYQQKWMFTLNEKDTFYALDKIVTEEGYRLFAKVRLLDLITPVRNHKKYQANLWKIQAKHVDFVITTQNLVAKYIIELDDNSHDTAKGQQRDQFVDAALQACGYKVLRIRGIQPDLIRSFLKNNESAGGADGKAGKIETRPN